MKLVEVLAFLMAFAFIYLGGQAIYDQRETIHSFQPVDAIIMESKLIPNEAVDGEYSPHILYRYLVDDQFYQSHLAEYGIPTTDRDDLEALVSLYVPGKKVKAYYNPHNPGEAFLYLEYSYFPYAFFTIGLLLLMVLIQGRWLFSRNIQPPEPCEIQLDGWFRLASQSGLGRRIRITILCLIIGLPGIVAGWHYFSVAQNPHYMAEFVTGTFAAVLLFFLTYLLHQFLLTSAMEDVSVSLNHPYIRSGEKIHIRLSQLFYHDCEILRIMTILRCQVTYRGDTDIANLPSDLRLRAQKNLGAGWDLFYYQQMGREASKPEAKALPRWKQGRASLPPAPMVSHICYQARAVSHQDHTAKRGETLQAEHEYFIPLEIPVSPHEQTETPRFDWYLEVQVEIDDYPDYHQIFVLPGQAGKLEKPVYTPSQQQLR